MVKFYESTDSYNYDFKAVSLAFWLRYFSPFGTHVLSTDVIDRSVDPSTGRLSTTRIHVKQSRLPAGVLKLLPKSVLGNVNGGSSSSYILERSTIDLKEGWMQTESRNLDWTGILSVVERQAYKRDQVFEDGIEEFKAGTTNVTTTVKFRSRLGDRLRARARPSDGDTKEVDEEPKKSLIASWSASGIQRSIEAIASRRTSDQLGRAKEGMNVVLERLRSGGLTAVLVGMAQDRDAVLGPEGPWKRAWKVGDRHDDHKDD